MGGEKQVLSAGRPTSRYGAMERGSPPTGRSSGLQLFMQAALEIHQIQEISGVSLR